ncbi:MAG: amino acid adenylation domain-containing protein [Verrucomicrobiales bacterium]
MAAPPPARNSRQAADTRPLHHLLDARAEHSPETLVYRHLLDGETEGALQTYRDIRQHAGALAHAILETGSTGKPVIIIQPPGPDFITALFACWYAGAIAIPAYPPRGKRHKQRLLAILRDSGADTLVGSPGDFQLPGVRHILTSGSAPARTDTRLPDVDPRQPCLLQYTSGSTAEPKGVMLSHHNFRSHFKSLACYRDFKLTSAVSWLPPYHDMGLVLKILYAFEAGIPLTLMSPDHFIQRPVRWLEAIHNFRGELSGSPNFALEACLNAATPDDIARLDLSCWKIAPLGAERIRPDTLDRFARTFAPCGFSPGVFRPGYGLAESTLILTAWQDTGPPTSIAHPTAGRLLTSGTPLPGVEIRIANPQTGETTAPGETGEIRAKSPVIASGYWNRPEQSAAVFGSPHPELKTGDLGFIRDGHLYISGRIKDLIIIDGINIFPDDVESAILAAIPEISAAAAFSSDAGKSESLTLALETATRDSARLRSLCSSIRETLAESLEIPVARTVFVRNGLLPRTTSGKLQRNACKQALESASLKLVFDEAAAHPAPTPTPAITPDFVVECVAAVTGHPRITPQDDLASLAISSLDATRITALIRSRTGRNLSIHQAFSAPSFTTLAGTLAAAGTTGSGLPDPTATRALTHSQERMWFLRQFDPHSAAYHVFGALELSPAIDLPKLQAAFRQTVSRHDILLSRHCLENNLPAVTVAPDTVPSLTVEPSTGDPAPVLKRFATRPFDLESEPPIRALLIQRPDHRHILAVCAHHIAADGWSMRILTAELGRIYHALLEDRPHRLPAAPSYLAYASSHRAWIESGAADPQITHWKNLLAGHPGLINLPTDFPRPKHPSSLGGIAETPLPAALVEQIAALAKTHRATPFMVHLAAFLVLLEQHGAGTDNIVAIPVANRNHHQTENLVGTLVNTLPFRFQLRPDTSFSTLLEHVKHATLDMLANQDAPFEKIIEAVQPERSGEHAPLAQVMFDHQEIPVADGWPHSAECRHFPTHRGASQFDLSLLLTSFASHQQLAFEYRADLFKPATAGKLLDRLLTLLQRACSTPATPVNQLSCLTSDDLAFLTSSSCGPSRPDFPAQTVPALIAARAAKHPARTAVTSADNALDYREISTLSSHIAAHLRTRGIRPGDRVAVLLDRDHLLPAALLAIWKTGAAYVPLDRANPPERLRLILDDQHPVAVLVAPDLASHLPATTSAIHFDRTLIAATDPQPDHPTQPDQTAYVIYTSGSTGTPKGVSVSHAALANFILSMAETPGFTEADRLLAVTTVSFDISLLELFLPLAIGGSLELLPSAKAADGHALLKQLSRSAATVMQATPATWRLMLDAGWKGSPHLKILCGGEAIDPTLAARLVTMGAQLWNLYGPTETTVWSSQWRVPAHPQHIRIGRPIANTGLHVLSPDRRTLPPGVPGNLWISGAGLAQGYWKNPTLTAERFAGIHPLPDQSTRAYHTGDIARWHPDGTLECLGRSDGQVKIRGFRVELGEIESILASHPDIAQAKAALRGPDPASPRLVAWIRNRDPDRHTPPAGIRDFLAARLPSYMRPADIGVVPTFPLNSSGKVDVSNLPDPQTRTPQPQSLTRTETRVIAIWSQLLNRPAILPDDNWFHIGGHSLLALRLFARLHSDLGVRLPLSAILDHPTPRSLSFFIDKNIPPG